MSQANKLHVFESPWKRGDNDSSDRALVRGGPEAPSATRTPLNRTHHVKLLEAAQLLDDLFPEGVERIEVRFVYSERSYQKQFLTGNWELPEGDSRVPSAEDEGQGETNSLGQFPNLRTRTKDADFENPDVWTVGYFPPIRKFVRTR
jgi:hypothetical protein